MGRITRGWELAKLSMRVLRADQSLAVFPILSTVLIALAAVAIATPTFLVGGFSDDSPLAVVVAILIAFVSTYLAIFFNVALVSCAARSFQGEDTQVREGIAAANARAGVIFRWALLATTVGLILRALEERLPLAGRIATWLVGAAWAMATYFVIPVIAFEEVGPIDAVKRSASIVRAKWGEAAVGQVSISLAVLLVTLLCAAPLILIGMFTMATMLPLAVFAWALAGLVVIVGGVLSSTLTQIFNVALYNYAQTGEVPTGFHAVHLNGALGAKG